MIERSSTRRRLAWAAFAALVCSAVAGFFRMHLDHRSPAPTTMAQCAAADRDSAQLAIFATDTIAAIRARRQRVQRFTRTADGIEVRTEDNDPLAAHDGGLAAFDCSGRLTFLWLDGG